jgi:hypothetical protein
MVSTGLIRLFTAQVALLLVACDLGPPLPRVDRFRVRRLSARQAARPWPVTIEGRQLATSARHPLRFELWRQRPARPPVRVVIEDLRRDGARVYAQMPAGTPPGEYRLVAYRGARGRLTRHRLRVWAPRSNVGYPVLSSVRARRRGAGEGGRLVITGANLLQPALITLHGPQGRGRRAVTTRAQGQPRMVGRKVQMPFLPLYRRMRITELPRPRQATPNRIVATLPRTLAPGRYYVQVYTATHRGNKPDVTFLVGGRLGSGQRIWGTAAVGLLLLLAVCCIALLGRPLRGQRRRLGVLLGILLACAAPLFFLL